MTKIVIRKSADGCYRSFECRGHAGYADSGSDIVCASVSILVINTLNALEILCGEKMECQEDEKKGWLRCLFLQPLSEGGVLLMDTLLLGLTNIQQQYGKKFVKVKFKEV